MTTWGSAVPNPFDKPEPKQAWPEQPAPIPDPALEWLRIEAETPNKIVSQPEIKPVLDFAKLNTGFPPQPPNLGVVPMAQVIAEHCAKAEVAPADWHTLTPDLNNLTFAVPTHTEMTPEQVELLTEWEKTQTQLKTLKAYEMELRKCVVYSGGFFDASKTSGTQHAELDGGYKLTAVKSENYNLNSDLVEGVLAHFSDDLAKLLVSWKATLSVSTYKKLSAEQQALFNGCLEITNGAPKLEIKSPKASA